MIQYFEIPSIDKTVRKALLDGIVQRVLAESGLAPQDITYTDEFNTQLQPNSQQGDERELSFGGSNRTFVEFTETRNDVNRISRGVGLDIDLPFFNDPTRAIKAQPIGTQYDVEVTVTRRSRSRDDIQRWCNRLNSLIDMGRYSLMTETEFYYVIPKPLIMLLHDCYIALNERTALYTDFKSYLKEHFGDSVTVITNVAGGQKTLAVRHALTRIEIVYDLTPPEEQKEEKYWAASFRFNFEYMRPEEVVAAHPLIINQTQIHERWFPDPSPPWESNEVGVNRTDGRKLKDASTHDGVINWPWLPNGHDGALGLVIPKHKEVIFGSDLCFEPINMVTPVVIIRPGDLPFDYVPGIQDYIDDCNSKWVCGNGCVINYDVYINNIPIPTCEAKWNDGELQYHGDIIVENNYYITVNIITEWSGFTPEQIHNLGKFPEAADAIVGALLPDYPLPPSYPPHVIDKIVDEIRNKQHDIKQRGLPIKRIYTSISAGTN